MSLSNTPFGTQHLSQPAPLPTGPKKSNKTLWIVLGVVGGIGLFSIIGCIGLIAFIGAKFAIDSDEIKTIPSSDGLTEIDVPKNWTNFPNPNQEATIFQANILSEKYVIVISEKKHDLFGRNRPDSKLQEYSEMVIAGIKARGVDGKCGPGLPIKINGLQGLRHQLDIQVDEIPFAFWVTCVEGSTHCHQILAWTSKSKAESNKESLLKIAGSFRERGK